MTDLERKGSMTRNTLVGVAAFAFTAVLIIAHGAQGSGFLA